MWTSTASHHMVSRCPARKKMLCSVAAGRWVLTLYVTEKPGEGGAGWRRRRGSSGGHPDNQFINISPPSARRRGSLWQLGGGACIGQGLRGLAGMQMLLVMPPAEEGAVRREGGKSDKLRGRQGAPPATQGRHTYASQRCATWARKVDSGLAAKGVPVLLSRT